MITVGSEALILFENSSIENTLKLYSKKVDLESGNPEKIDGIVATFQFNKEIRLNIELEYLLDHLSDK